VTHVAHCAAASRRDRGHLSPTIVLHRRQPLGPGARSALGGRRGAVTIWSAGDSHSALRAGLAPGWAIEAVSDFDVRFLPSNAEIVTNDEYALESCADLRQELSLPRRLPRSLAPWLDKVIMKERLREATIRVPAAVSLDPFPGRGTDGAAEALVARLGLPLVGKPRRGGNNSGITVLQSRGAVRRWLASHLTEPGWEAEEFLDGQLYHANALVVDGLVVPVIVGEYVRPLLALSEGLPSGSITLPNDHPVRRIGETLNPRVARALGADGAFVMHIEFFVREAQPYVIDVAARAPGALVPQIALAATGLDLERANFELQLTGVAKLAEETGTFAAWLWEPSGEFAKVPMRSRHLAFGDRVGGRTLPAIIAWSRDFEQLSFEIAARAGAPTLGRG
jgi:hypothetical protein